MKTNELIGAALDWAVRYALNSKPPADYVFARDNFSTCWNKGGPIIERARIAAIFSGEEWVAGVCTFVGSGGDPVFEGGLFSGPAPLIAAMRCYVASKLGDDVQVPEELQP